MMQQNFLNSQSNMNLSKSTNIIDISPSNPFYKDDKIQSILNQFNYSRRESEARTRDQSYSSIGGGMNKHSNSISEFQLSVSSPNDWNNTKYSDILSETSPSMIMKQDQYINNAESSIFMTSRDMERQRNSILELNEQVNKLNDNNKNLNESNKSLSDIIIQYELENNHQKKTLEKYERSIVLLDEKNNELQQQLFKKKDESSHTSLNYDPIKQEQINQEIQKKTEQFQHEKEHLVKEKQMLKIEIEDLKKRNQIQISQPFTHSQIFEENLKLKQLVEELKTKCKQLEIQCAENEKKSLESDDDLDVFEMAASKLDSKRLQDTIDKKDQEIKELQTGMSYLHSQLHDEVNRLRDQEFTPEYQYELETKIIEQDEKITQQDQRLEALTQTILLLDQKNKEQEELIQKQAVEIENLQTVNMQIKEDNLALKITVSCQEKDFEEIQQTYLSSVQDSLKNTPTRSPMTKSLDISKFGQMYESRYVA